MRFAAALIAVFCVAAAPVPPSPYSAQVRVSFDRTSTSVTFAEGKADASGRAVTADDPVRLASVSKLVTALGVMRLVEAGRLDLDRDVSDYLGWRLRHPDYPDTPITLRLLLSHRSGLMDGDDLYLIPLGETVRGRLGDVRVWDRAHAPGSFYRYTNLNFPVVASVMEAATGERFDRLMTRIVFRPLKLDGCFNWSGCSDRAVARAVTLFGADGSVRRDALGGKRPDCLVNVKAGVACDLSGYRPADNGALFSPQGGVRISMRDLARIGQMLLRGGDGFLTRRSIATLTAPVWRYDGSNGATAEGGDGGFLCAYGLAVQTLAQGGARCRDDLFGDGIARVGHAGDAYGLKSGLWIDPKAGTGVAYFVTAVPGDAPAGARSAFTAAEEAMTKP
jgi:CubicO group peptidase (beta-lactamase class C family)